MKGSIAVPSRARSLAVVTFAAVACAGPPAADHADDSDGISASDVSGSVRRHLLELLSYAQEHSMRRLQVDWQAVEDSVLRVAAGSSTVREAEPAIQTALALIDDGHAIYITRDGRRITAFEPCPVIAVAVPELPADVGYVRVPGCCEGTTPEAFASDVQEQIRRMDGPAINGWIVDLRSNSGGNMWPMLAGLTPLLRGDTLGYFFNPNDLSRQRWWSQDGAAGTGTDAVVRLPRPYRLSRSVSRLAVLTNEATVSSGEAVVIAFRHDPRVRTFGQPTCGRSTANGGTALSNGATLVLAVAHMVDRAGNAYGGRISPDETAHDADEAVERAIRWLQEVPQGSSARQNSR